MVGDLAGTAVVELHAGPEGSNGSLPAPTGTTVWWRDLFLRPHTARDLQRTSFLAFLLCSGFLCAVLLALVAS